MCDNAEFVEDDFKPLMVKFTISHVLEGPEDVVTYALNYFKALQEARERYRICQEAATISTEVTEVPEGDEIDGPQLEFRRNCVFSDDYNPQEDFGVDKVLHEKTDEERAHIVNTVCDTFPFTLLDMNQMNCVVDAMLPMDVIAGDDIIRQGDDADKFFIVRRGVYYVHSSDQGKPTKLLAVLDQDGYFGEKALCHRTEYPYNVKAMTDGELWVIERYVYRRRVTKAAFYKRKFDEELINCMPYFKDLSVSNRMCLVDNLVHKVYAPGETIVKVGDPSTAIYFVVRGIVKITIINDCGLEVTINELEKPDYFGEAAYLWKKPRSFSAYADDNTEVEVAYLEVDAFERTIGSIADVLGKVFKSHQLKTRPSDSTNDDQSVCF
ncbi:cAMP-dependent protein kinase type II regulatory subunit-like [Agrilus planipennis]|uniref:cAMP-dependent protein kinase type II-alpha regulatory subunit n=1 Tax=Agrilus planipennis TaxID=224129 RepID=A0A1W4X5F3_AGRPL|nr:cAMP-dependent protein kinase type II regulatory subunit-like [Agrilus planipennis]